MLKKIALKIVATIFVITTFLGIMHREANAALDATLSFDQSTVSTTVGQTVTLVARVNPGTNQVGAVELDIMFIPSVLRLDSITRSSAFNTTLAGPTIDNLSGTASFSVGLLTNPATYVTTTSDVATYVFTALSTATNSPVSIASTSNASALGEYVVSTRTGSQITVNASGGGDTTSPTITAFNIPSTATTLTVAVNTFTATDAVGVTGYKLTESANAPAIEDAGWSTTAQTNYTFTSAGNKTLYAWTKDAAGNVSNSLNGTVIITLPEDLAPEVAISNGVPAGKLPKDTTSINLSVITDKKAVCKFSEDDGFSFDESGITFTTTGEMTHYYTIDGVKEGRDYEYYVKCRDEGGIINSGDYKIDFSIKEKSSDDEDQQTKRKVSNSASRISRGATLIQSGKRFSKDSDVLLYFSKAGGGYYAPTKVKTSSTGKFSVSYKVNKPIGKYNWYALDTKTGKKSKLKDYTVE